MPFDMQRAGKKLQDVLGRIRQVNSSIRENILEYRSKDVLESEEDERKTMQDIRFYLLKSYKDIDSILTELDRYK
ncbi:MAG: hypothetical protein KBC69_01450 [Candidatus Magasanikbacteria bacterium]|nr:hypothetical protein [Candidatus Magasanikbacteria bacterium]